MPERIIVTEAELEKTFRIWVNQAPRRMWQDYFRCSETTYKWGGGNDPFDRFDPRHALAKYLALKFTTAGWAVTSAPWEGGMVDTPAVRERLAREREAGPNAARPNETDRRAGMALPSDNNLDEPDQGALFKIEGPDDDGCVWICAAGGRDIWCQNLGPYEPAATVMADWLGQNDFGED